MYSDFYIYVFLGIKKLRILRRFFVLYDFDLRFDNLQKAEPFYSTSIPCHFKPCKNV